MNETTDPNLAVDPDAIVISEKVGINAPASVVWDILTDMPKYGEWNPFCVECESTLEMGAPVKMKLKSYVNAGPEFFDNCEYVCAFEPEKLLSWQLPITTNGPTPRGGPDHRGDRPGKLPLSLDGSVSRTEWHSRHALCGSVGKAGV